MTDYEKLKGIIDEIDVLTAHHADASAPKFKAWQTKTERFLIKKYGADSLEYKKFVDVNFSSMAWLWCDEVQTRRDAIEECRNGLLSCKEVFKTYLEEMAEEGETSVISQSVQPQPVQLSNMNKIFIVHGHDGELKQHVARIVEKQGIEAVILSEQVNQGRTIVEKFEANSDVGGAICLFTADDVGKAKDASSDSPRARQNVVLETGMGGRMDSTNIIPPPQVAVITAISLDHMAFLGDTEEKIAAQKAGIIKPGSRSVLYSQGKTVMRVLENACLDAASPVTETDWGQLKVWEEAMERQVFDYRHRKGLVIKLSGRYQIKNACTALDAVDCLNKDGAGITEGQIREGLLKTVWRGRFERISRHPDVIVDGAHNPAGARSLSESLKAYFPDKKKILVMGVFADKDYENILKIMASTGDRLITFRPDHPRGLDSGKLAKTAEKYFENVRDGKDVAGALRIAYETATEKDIIACFGSLSTIAPICDIIFTKAPSRADSFVYKGEALAQETE